MQKKVPYPSNGEYNKRYTGHALIYIYYRILSCHFSISAKYKYTIDQSLAVFSAGSWAAAHAVRGGAGRILWVEQPWNVHPWKLDREIFEDGPHAKIGSLENFRPYGK